MKIRLHHVNVSSPDLPELDAFYREVLDLGQEPTLNQSMLRSDGVRTRVSFLTDGTTQFHISEQDLTFGFRANKPINPLERGHIAFRTDDLAEFKRRLEARGIPYADFGDFAMKGWQQIFFQDPAGTIIEVHQVVGDKTR
jgi:catechol 2,3-dioxygenase-like lactoylglutathione lyase family enzyme